MKYREEFEVWFADYCCMSPSERDRFFRTIDSGEYFLGETSKRHHAFVAGYEAAQRKSVEIWAEKNGYEVINNEPTA